MGNIHKFVAMEDSCFFDICLPNYTADSLRRITYFNEIANDLNSCDVHGDNCDTILEYYTTPPILPVGFEIAELDYRGDFMEAQTIARI